MRTWALLLAGLLAISTTLSQAKSDPPLFASPDFNPALIERIDVFVVDTNNDAADDHECVAGAGPGNGLRHVGTDEALRDRGYNGKKHLGTRFYTAPIPLSDSMLSSPSKEWLQDLSSRKYLDRKSKEMPPPGQWIMVITIDELGSGHNPIKGPGRASLSMYLFDRDQGALLWHDQASTKMWSGVLDNLMRKGDIKRDACGTLAYSMIKKLPKHKK